jgi:hypothetical protein
MYTGCFSDPWSAASLDSYSAYYFSCFPQGNSSKSEKLEIAGKPAGKIARRIAGKVVGRIVRKIADKIGGKVVGKIAGKVAGRGHFTTLRIHLQS